ncbi:uncharacterized protein ATC70_006667 [Mucor velutinosus]|uniref:SMP-LTD domain-containing protein n=1 Tax=Mucor velutinosus TaxID=708070 RepID=A0AAN7DNY9_9FUNG|nr:hypothetical protein ATC70_006667 [Mucor velutinosus]
MVSFIGFIVIYVLGGVTFLPFIALAAFIYIKGGIEPLLPKAKPKEPIHIATKDDDVIVKKGWIRLTNQYQPKMPEVNSGNGIISGIQSYVSGSSNSNANLKKGLVYALLKHGTLFCYESEKQQNLVMILPMQDFQVSLYPPNPEDKPEGEIYNRTSVIRLVPSAIKDDITLTSKNVSVCTLPEDDITCYPTRVLYLTCGRNIDKEDWYFGLLDAHQLLQDQPPDGPQYVMMDNTRFDQDALEELIRQVQSTPSHRETAWINAVFGRLFLGMYKTDRLKHFMEMKIRRKIDKTKRPTFLDEIHVRSVDVGASVPFITDPKLLSLSTEGEVIVEAKVEYAGGLTIEIETDFNWSYSSRMKPIRMNLILAVKLNRLAGRMMFKLKAPPTNRYWLAFFEMPEMDWKITPVVADKQIKLNIVTNAIESRIREVMAETFVLPNMDDTSFCPSGGKGGIFGEYVKVQVQKKKPSEPSYVADDNEAITHERPSSVHSSASSSSSTSNKIQTSEAVRETPTVPDADEKPTAADMLKLKNRRAESAAEMAPNGRPAFGELAPLRKLELSQSTPNMQQPPTKTKFQQEDAASVKSVDRNSITDPIISASSTSTKWSKNALRKRVMKYGDDGDDSDSESVASVKTNSTGGSGLLNKISNLLPIDNNNKENGSDAFSVRSGNHHQTSSTSSSKDGSKKNALINMAESFLHKKNSHDDDIYKPASEEKKELYAERMANMRRRAEERRLSGSSASSGRSIPPPSSSAYTSAPVFKDLPDAPTVTTAKSVIADKTSDHDYSAAAAPPPPPIKPRRTRAASAAQNNSDVPDSMQKQHPPLPPRRNSTPAPMTDDVTATSPAVSEQVADSADSEQISNPNAPSSGQEFAPPSLVVKEPAVQVDSMPTLPQQPHLAPAIPDKPRPVSSTVHNENTHSPPPLPTTPRPKLSPRLDEAKPALPNVPRPVPPTYEKVEVEEHEEAALNAALSPSSPPPPPPRRH